MIERLTKEEVAAIREQYGLLTTSVVARLLQEHGVGTVEGVRKLVLKGELDAIFEARGKRGTYWFRGCDIEEYVWARQGSRKLLEISFFKEIGEKVGQPIQRFFGHEAGALVAIMPGGFVFAITLLSYLIRQHRCYLRLILMGKDQGPWERNLILGRKLLLLDSVAITGRTLKKAKRLLMERADVNESQVKTFVYGDFSGTADFCVVRVQYNNRLDDLDINLV